MQTMPKNFFLLILCRLCKNNNLIDDDFFFKASKPIFIPDEWKIFIIEKTNCFDDEQKVYKNSIGSNSPYSWNL
jgi:hypothetical protein